MGSNDLDSFIREFTRLRSYFQDPARHGPGRVQVLDWDLEYVYGPSVPAFLEYQLIRGVNDFIAENESPLILDCGANIGFSAMAYKRRYPNAKVIAFEPDPLFLPVMRRNLERNGMSDVEVVGKAVWYQDGQAEWFCEGIDGSKLALPNSDPSKVVSVETVNLANYFNQPVDMIKVDIEGSEYALLTHFGGKLGSVKNLSIECHIQQENLTEFGCLLTFLKDEGFQLGINGLNWRDLVTQPEIPPGHFSQYIVVSAWKEQSGSLDARFVRLAPNMPVDFEVLYRNLMNRVGELDHLERSLDQKNREADRRLVEAAEKLQTAQTREQEFGLARQQIDMWRTELENARRELERMNQDLQAWQANITAREQRYDRLFFVRAVRLLKRILNKLKRVLFPGGSQ